MIKNIFKRLLKKTIWYVYGTSLRRGDTRSAAKKQKLGVNLGPTEGCCGLDPLYTSDLTTNNNNPTAMWIKASLERREERALKWISFKH